MAEITDIYPEKDIFYSDETGVDKLVLALVSNTPLNEDSLYGIIEQLETSISGIVTAIEDNGQDTISNKALLKFYDTILDDYNDNCANINYEALNKYLGLI